jgi:hypothetical protein
MTQTKVGRELFQKAIDAKYIISINIEAKAPVGETRFGKHIGSYEKTTKEYGGGEIYLYLDNIKNELDGLKKAKQGQENGVKYTGITDQT